MLFHDDRCCPDQFAEPRTRQVLTLLCQRPAEILQPHDALAAILHVGDAKVVGLLAQALRPGGSLHHLQKALGTKQIASPPAVPSPRYRRSFKPTLLRALEEFDGSVQASQGLLDPVCLETLLLCVLTHADGQDLIELNDLDVDRARGLLQEQIGRAFATKAVEEVIQRGFGKTGPRSASPPPDGPFRLPPELAPSEDLTWRVKTSEVPDALPFDGEPAYEKLFDQIARALHRRQTNHVLLTGERGVGKTTLVTELARRAAIGKISFLRQKRFLSIDCRYFPVDESRQRLVALLNSILGRPELVVCIDGFATLLRSDRLASNKPVLLSALSQARCQFVGLLTSREYEELVSDDPDFPDFFSRVEVEEPELEVAVKLLLHFARALEQRFRVTIEDQAVRQVVTLSANYILNDQLPGKALKILQRVCEDIDYERAQLGSLRNRVTVEDMVRLVSEISGVPEETLRGIAEQSDYQQSLREVIFGQDHAVREVATELGLIKAGMTDPGKPASVMLFLGQTGTGKTEMAKALARFYSTSKKLKTYTLGNCVEPHSVSTIIGVPPGYVGTDRGGRLINELNADPYCVFLLDEADKAHPDVLQPFLNLFDEGWVSDQRGTRAFANKSIFILTTNVGQKMIADMVEQGRSIEEITTRMKEALSQIRHSKSDRPVFTPEFLARIKRIIVFNPLTKEAMMGITRKLIGDLQKSWAEKRGKFLLVPEPLVTHLGERSHHLNDQSKGKEGGRIVRKLISEWLEAGLQREISLRPAQYKTATGIEVMFAPPTNSGEQPAVGTPELSFKFLAE